MTDTEDITGAQEALHHVGLPDIDPRILAAALDTNPSIAGTARSWGWTDTEVRDDVAEAVTRLMLGLSRDEYLRRVYADERGLAAELEAAHARWLAANPPLVNETEGDR